MRSKLVRFFLCILTGIVLLAASAGSVMSEASAPAIRTILLYGCGSNLESDGGYLTWNLKQILEAEIAPEINFLLLTGGSYEWETEAEYLEGAEKVGVDQHVQLWLCSGKNGANAVNGHGKMSLLDNWPAGFASASMSNPDTLLAFLNIAAEQYPAEMYDLILWDHGGGPQGGFASDQYYEDDSSMSVGAITRAIRQSGVKHLDILDFDACLMASAEVAAALGGYTDYLVFSSETEPGYGQEYTTWLNALAQDPRMNGFELGRTIVDAYIAFYDNPEAEWYGATGTLSVVDTANFRERMVEPLTRLARVGEQELTKLGEKNWKINYYDELNSRQYMYQFDLDSMVDLASLTNALGISRTEIENCELWEWLINAYTAVGQELEQILADQDGSGDDVLYSRCTESSVRTTSSTYFFVRDMDGELVHAEQIRPSGLSLFYSPTDTSSTLEYSEAIDGMLAAVQDQQSREMLKAWRNMALRGLLVYESGRTVAELMESGDRSVFYKDVRESWTTKRDLSYEEISAYKRQMHISAEITSMKSARWDEYIGRVIGILDEHSTIDTENWLALVTAQQAIESVAGSRAKAAGVDSDGDGALDAYRVTVDSPMSLVGDVSLVFAADLDLREDQKELQLSTMGDHVILGKVHGFPATEGFLDDANLNGSLTYAAGRLYEQETTSYDLPTTIEKWYEIRDSEGNGHLVALDELDLYSASEVDILVKMVLARVDENGDRITVPGLLHYAGGRFTTFLDLFYGDRPVPLSDKQFDGAEMIPCSVYLFDLGFMKWPVYIEIGEAFPLSASADRGLSLVMTPLSEIRDLQGKELKYKGVITDLYGCEHDIESVLEAVDPSAELICSLEKAKVTAEAIVYDGNPHKPVFTVVYGGKELANGTDFRVMVEPQTDPGEYKAIIYGTGDYVGHQIVMFSIEPAEE